MTLTQLASKLCKLEGKKSQIKVGDMREALKLLFVLNASYKIKEMNKYGQAGLYLRTSIETLMLRESLEYVRQYRIKKKRPSKKS